jgi:hypothetical protein
MSSMQSAFSAPICALKSPSLVAAPQELRQVNPRPEKTPCRIYEPQHRAFPFMNALASPGRGLRNDDLRASAPTGVPKNMLP